MSACASTSASAAVLIGALRKLQRACQALSGRLGLPHPSHHRLPQPGLLPDTSSAAGSCTTTTTTSATTTINITTSALLCVQRRLGIVVGACGGVAATAAGAASAWRPYVSAPATARAHYSRDILGDGAEGGGGAPGSWRGGEGGGPGSGSGPAAGSSSSSSSNSGGGGHGSSSSDGGGGARGGPVGVRHRGRGGGAVSGGREGGGGGGCVGKAGDAPASATSTSTSTSTSPLATPSPPPSLPFGPPPLPPSSGPLAVREFPSFSLVLHRLPPLSCPRSPAEQRCLGAALAVVARLRSHGYTAMFAGGWVRDQFLGRPSADIDLVTNATTVQIFDVFGPHQAKLKGGNTCDVTRDGIAFEVTSYRGGLHDDCEEAEWRDAACRDFTLNALFFDPKIQAHHHHHQQPLLKAGGEGAVAAGSGGPPPPFPPPLLPDPAQQPEGVVKDYVGGLVDLRAARLRLFRNHTLLGNMVSSVEMDPVRVLRAARLSVELKLAVEGHTEERLRRAAAKCVMRQNGVTANRVYRELSKMNDLDKPRTSTSSGTSNNTGSSGDRRGVDGGVSGGGGAGGPAVGGRPGSRLFAAALERCRQWRALEALFPGLPQEHLQRVLRDVLPRLPAELPLELKLACLVVAPVGSGGGLMPWNQYDKYDPIISLLSEARQSQPGRHYPALLCDLTDLLITDYYATTRLGEWARLLAAEGAGQVEVAMEAFMPRDFQWRLRERLADIRNNLMQQLQPPQPPQPPGAAAAAGGGVAQQQQQNWQQQNQHQQQQRQQQQQRSSYQQQQQHRARQRRPGGGGQQRAHPAVASGRGVRGE